MWMHRGGSVRSLWLCLQMDFPMSPLGIPARKQVTENNTVYLRALLACNSYVTTLKIMTQTTGFKTWHQNCFLKKKISKKLFFGKKGFNYELFTLPEMAKLKLISLTSQHCSLFFGHLWQFVFIKLQYCHLEDLFSIGNNHYYSEAFKVKWWETPREWHSCRWTPYTSRLRPKIWLLYRTYIDICEIV